MIELIEVIDMRSNQARRGQAFKKVGGGHKRGFGREIHDGENALVNVLPSLYR